MNFKNIGLGLAATAAMSAGMALAEAPAQAASLADSVLTGRVRLTLDGLVTSVTPTLVDLGPSGSLSATSLPGTRFANSTGSFAGITGGSIKDLPIGTAFPTGGISSFLTLTDASRTIQFDLVSLSNEQLNDVTGTQGGYQARLRGIFKPTNQVNLPGGQLFQVRFDDDFNTGSLVLTPIPTPALLPGLVGMGLAALRKRKGEAEESEEVKA